MSDRIDSFSRRKFLATTALGAVAATIAMPSVLRAQGAGVKLGVLHPVTGALSYSGQQGRLGATLAIEEINAAGGIKALGGAKIEPVLGDAQSTPEGGNAEVEKMNSAGVAAIVGGLVSYPIAVLGALIIGLIEAWSAFYASAFKEVIVFTALIPVLIVRSFLARETPEEEVDE